MNFSLQAIGSMLDDVWMKYMGTSKQISTNMEDAMAHTMYSQVGTSFAQMLAGDGTGSMTVSSTGTAMTGMAQMVASDEAKTTTISTESFAELPKEPLVKELLAGAVKLDKEQLSDRLNKHLKNQVATDGETWRKMAQEEEAERQSRRMREMVEEMERLRERDFQRGRSWEQASPGFDQRWYMNTTAGNSNLSNASQAALFQKFGPA